MIPPTAPINTQYELVFVQAGNRALVMPIKDSQHNLAVDAGRKLAEHLWQKAERGSLRVERVDFRDSPYTPVFEIEDAGVREPGAVQRAKKGKSWKY